MKIKVTQQMRLLDLTHSEALGEAISGEAISGTTSSYQGLKATLQALEELVNIFEGLLTGDTAITQYDSFTLQPAYTAINNHKARMLEGIQITALHEHLET